MPPLSLDGVTLALSSAHDILFDAHGQGIRSMSVEVYRLDGKRVFRQEQTGNRFLWHLNEDNGLLVANGVYLYRVTAYGSNGGIMEDSVQRLLILR
ncbi:hypothetical protein HYR53_09795 [Candidatus Acetothermia bacterium]|nr:hypothetical protein [Candidatus Acetothermia bacterium]